MQERWFAVAANYDGPKFKKTNMLIRERRMECSEAELLGTLCMIWSFGILDNADQDGRLLYVSARDIANYLRYKNSGSRVNPDAMVDLLIETGWLDEIEGDLYIHNWDVRQEHWFKYTDKIQKDRERKRESRRNAKAAAKAAALPKPTDENEPKEDTQNESPEKQEAEAKESMGEKGSDEKAESEPKKKEKSDYPTGFEEFWKAYPRNADKGQAYDKYKARINDGFSPEELLQAAQNYAVFCQKNRTEPKYIKHAKTFLGSSTPFTDFLPKKTEIEQEEVPEGGNPFAKFGGEDDEIDG